MSARKATRAPEPRVVAVDRLVRAARLGDFAGLVPAAREAVAGRSRSDVEQLVAMCAWVAGAMARRLPDELVEQMLREFREAGGRP